MVMREVDEDLAIFLGMKNGEKERIALAHNISFVFTVLDFCVYFSQLSLMAIVFLSFHSKL